MGLGGRRGFEEEALLTEVLPPTDDIDLGVLSSQSL